MKILQKGFNYSQDGPGNRLVYHLQGCNFRCKWCSNPESMPMNNPKAKDYSVDEIVSEVQRSRMMFFDGGGVTFTGGECTLPADELIEVLRKLKAIGISTAIETNGSNPRLPEIAKLVDYLIVDFKHFDSESHKKWIGTGNAQVLKNLEQLIASGRELHIRIPLIKGVNDEADGFCEFFKNKNTDSIDVEILPYHEFGKDKWTTEYEITDGFVSDETVREFNKKLNDIGIKTIRT
ncbi:MAG: radical SAM protein [Clostridia bacterium]|nr:radical SAM protein [Clostridia bacterium]